MGIGFELMQCLPNSQVQQEGNNKTSLWPQRCALALPGHIYTSIAVRPATKWIDVMCQKPTMYCLSQYPPTHKTTVLAE